MCYSPCGRNREATSTTKLASRAKLNRVRLAFYRECLKENLCDDDIQGVAFYVSNFDSPKDVLAGIKAGKQRRRNIAGQKAAITRKKNARKMAKVWRNYSKMAKAKAKK